MRETKFIEQKQAKWKEYEAYLDSKQMDPNKLSEIYTHITDDLSYAKTFYPNRSVKVYLNNLAQRIFLHIEDKKEASENQFVYFWKTELPYIMYETRRDHLISFLIFFGAAILVGVFSTIVDPEFPRLILGDSYVNMTQENIANGDPMKVYKDSKELDMSLGITFNNILVALKTFALGGVFLLGSIYILISNGIMLGAFQTFFFQNGVIWDSLLTIWVHGTLEISAIVIAGGAGLTMGRGWIFPGTLSRLQSFQLSAKRGAKIIIGLLPIFVAAGFIEGYLTRHTEVHYAIRPALILICLAAVSIYFLWYPRQIAKTITPIDFSKSVNPSNFTPHQPGKILGLPEIIIRAIGLFKQHISVLLQFTLIAVASFIIVLYLFPNDVFTADFLRFPKLDLLADFVYLIIGLINESSTWSFFQFFNFSARWELQLVTPFLLYFSTTTAVHSTNQSETVAKWKTNLRIGFALGLLCLPFIIDNSLGILTAILFTPITLLICTNTTYFEAGFWAGVRRCFKLYFKRFWSYTLLCCLLAFQLWIVNIFFNSLWAALLLDILNNVIHVTEDNVQMASNIIMTGINVIAFLISWIYSLFAFHYANQSNHEIMTASDLNRRISQIGTVKKFKGLITEKSRG